MEISFNNTCVRCIHGGDFPCTSEDMIEQHESVVFANEPVGETSRSINIHVLAEALPHDILCKIYMDYFRPHKYSQLYSQITVNWATISQTIYSRHMLEFVNHLPIFLYSPIRKHIERIDPYFKNMLIDVIRRGYSSSFTQIPLMKTSIFVELLMWKYH
jgi:hypothetical protein